MTDIYLIRHGEAEGNDFRRMHGHYDSLLMPRGLKQAECVAQRMAGTHMDAVYASDLARATMTAIPLCKAQGVNLYRDPAFREIQMGSWEDMPYGYMLAFDKKRMHDFHHDPVHWYLEDAETFEEYTDRFLTRMNELARLHDGGTIAIFCHGAVMKGVLIRLFFYHDLNGIPMADNTGISHLCYRNGTYHYDFINDSSHVPVSISTFEYQKWWRVAKTKPDMYFQNREELSGIPSDLRDLPDGEQNLIGIWNEQPVAAVTLGKMQNECGEILGMRVKQELLGKNYSDQLLGCAFSYFRKLGAKSIRAVGECYPENVLSCFGFSSETQTRSIDTEGELRKALEQLN